MVLSCVIFLSLKVKLGELGLFSLEKRRLGENIPVALEYFKGAYKREAEGLFIWVGDDRIRSNDFKQGRGQG